MALVWQPQEQAYMQLCQLLSDYQKPGANQGLVSCQSKICTAFLLHFAANCHARALLGVADRGTECMQCVALAEACADRV
jgi:hypothetical protein